MAEGPQVLLRTEWLRRYIEGRRLRVLAAREDLSWAVERLERSPVERVFCRGKHIFVQFGPDLFLYNHMLMRGRWRRYGGGMLLPPDDAWLALDAGPHTICNMNGQILRVLSREEAAATVAGLGPDAMRRPFPSAEIEARVRSAKLPIAEAILDQSVVAGIGNTAKSEILFKARIAPDGDPGSLSANAMRRLLAAIEDILWESYDIGGRWLHRVYRRRGEPCPACGASIQMIRLAPSRRSTYYCPECQGSGQVRLV